ncbi:hypothetical protein [Vibrio mediterranei]|uniref:DUF2509 family protein n=1 Tax=Vibrio mediterranei TaxID=689 RepID=A0ABX5DA18_9VIBR|nr:hypothetical protein [Vibrio mediterranei]PCD85644.1 hypothetical protein COR52_25795 [Vibrio mediterranei]PRQ66523.1 hypothetical protein COR51_16450 [Vibrio mediterranei]
MSTSTELPSNANILEPILHFIILIGPLLYYLVQTVDADLDVRIWRIQTLSIERHVEQWKTQGNGDLSTLSTQVLCLETDLSADICGPNNDGMNTNPFGGHWIVARNRDHPTWFDITATVPNYDVSFQKTVKPQP